MYCTPFQGKKNFPSETFASYLVQVTSLTTDEVHTFVASTTFGVLQQDNERYTEFRISTNVDNGAQGGIAVTESGQYTYVIYGQSSLTNLVVTNAAVWGELERGLMTFSSAAAWSMPSISIPNNVVYYE